jgi:uncharacterized protein
MNDAALASYKDLDGCYLNELANAGFILEDAESEALLQEQAFAADKEVSDWMAISLAPTLACNYECPYCYEQNHTKNEVISDDVINGVFRLVDKCWQRDHFKSFELAWYGGEPTLCLDVIEKVSSYLKSYCNKRNIKFDSTALSNAGNIAKKTAERLAACGVTRCLPTIDGLRDLHNRRRLARDRGDSFARTLDGIKNLRNAGVEVGVAHNLDRNSVADFWQLRKDLHANGLDIFPSLMKDYRGDFGCGSFAKPDFNLFTREDYAWQVHEFFSKTPFTVDALSLMLRPVRNFCRGQLKNYYVIAPSGDVVRCEGRIGNSEHRLFNVIEDFDISKIQSPSYNPVRDSTCRKCPVLPLCKGQCAWDRATLDDGCHILKYTIGAYVKDYRNCFNEASGALTVLVDSRDPIEFFAQPFVCDYPGESVFAGTLSYKDEEDNSLTITKTRYRAKVKRRT